MFANIVTGSMADIVRHEGGELISAKSKQLKEYSLLCYVPVL